MVFRHGIEAHRLVVSLAGCTSACAWALFALLRSLDDPRRPAARYAGAALFAVHPVAVYPAPVT